MVEALAMRRKDFINKEIIDICIVMLNGDLRWKSVLTEKDPMLHECKWP